jgi:hypothetical protein
VRHNISLPNNLRNSTALYTGAVLVAALAVGTATFAISAEVEESYTTDVVETTTNDIDYSVSGGGIRVNSTANYTVTNTGDVTQTSNTTSGDAIRLRIDGNLTGTYNGSVTTQADFSDGIDAASNQNGNITGTNNGQISTSGSFSRALRINTGSTGSNGDPVFVGGDVNITNNGALTTTGDDSRAFQVDLNGGDATVKNNASGTITTSGEDSTAVNISAGNSDLSAGRQAQLGGAVDFRNDAAITTTGDFSDGVFVFSNGGTVFVGNTGVVATAGEDSMGLKASSGENRNAGDNKQTQAGSTVTVDNDGQITTEGVFSNAIEAWSNGGDVFVDNSALLSTSGEDAEGIGAYSGTNNMSDNRVVQVGGAVTVTNTGVINAGDSSALEAWSNGGAVNVTNSANLSAQGDGHSALRATSGTSNTNDDRVVQVGANVTVTNTGNLSTTGSDSSHALNADSNGGDVTVTNSGTLTTSGDGSDGLWAGTGESSITNGNTFQAGGNISITNNLGGTVSTSGDDASGLHAYTNKGTIIINNLANITTLGSGSDGIEAKSGENYSGTFSNGNNISINNSGTINTSSDDTGGIFANSVGGTVTIDNSGAITSSGNDYSAAIKAFSEQEVTSSGGALASAVNVTNSALLITSGEDSRGIEAQAQTTGVVTNTGDMNITGLGAIELRADTSASVTNEGNLLLIRNLSSGNAGNTERAISTRSAGTSFIDNSGNVTTTGNNTRGLAAMGLFSSEGGDDDGRATNATISNSGNISTNGENAHGIDIRASSETTFSNSGTIAASGTGARGVFIFSSGDVVFSNSGTISNDDDSRSAVASLGQYAGVDPTGANDLINNSGSISGGIFLGNEDDILNNTGTLSGDILLGSDNDILNLGASGDISGANFFGDNNGFTDGTSNPDGTSDTVNFDGNFTINGSQFSEFENAVLVSGVSSGSDLDRFTNLFTVGGGATFNAGGSTLTNLTSNGTTSVGVGETVTVDGDLNVGPNGKVNISISSANNFGSFIVGGDATFDNAGNFMVIVEETNTLAADETFSPVTANSIAVGGVDAGSSFLLEDNFLAFNFTGVLGAGSLNVTVEDSFAALLETVSGETRSELSEVVEFLETPSSSQTTEQQAVSQAITNVLLTFDDTETTELETFIEEISTAPGASSPTSAPGTSTVQAVGSLIQARVDQRITTQAPTTTTQSSTTDFTNNYAPNDEPQESVFTQVLVTENGYGTETSFANQFGGEFWLQGFGGLQSSKDGNTAVAGSNGGVSFGYDAFLESGALLGGGGVYASSYSKTTVTGGSTTTAKSDTYGFMGYYGDNFENGIGFSTSLGYFLSETDQKRVDSLGDTYDADQKSDTAYGSANIFYIIDAIDFAFTPSAGLTYTNVRQDGYTETSSTGVLNQTVSSSSLNSLIGSIGGSISKSERINGVSVFAEIHAAALYEFNDTLGSYSVSLGNGAVNFAPQNVASLDRLRGNIGGSLRFDHTDSLSTQVGYDAVFGSKTQEQNFRFRIGKKF